MRDSAYDVSHPSRTVLLGEAMPEETTLPEAVILLELLTILCDGLVADELVCFVVEDGR